MRKNKNPSVYCCYRAETGLTQSQFAKKVGCSTPTIQAVELGRLKPSNRLWLKMMLINIDYRTSRLRDELIIIARNAAGQSN